MDLDREFIALARQTAAECSRRGKEITKWTADNGTEVIGWSVEYGDRETQMRGNPGVPGGWFEESWGHWQTILDTNGKFWYFSFSGYEGTDYPNGALLMRDLRQENISNFVGSKGKPFSEWTVKLQRLPYT